MRRALLAFALLALAAALPAEAARPKPQGLTLEVAPKHDRSAPVRYRAGGYLLLGSGIGTAACRGRVTVRVRRDGRTIASRRTRVRDDCSYRTRVSVDAGELASSGRLRVRARFAGNSIVRPARSPGRTVRYTR